MKGKIKARGNEDRGKESNLRDSRVLHFLSTWNCGKVNINLKEALETIDTKHMQGKKLSEMGRKQEMCLIIFCFHFVKCNDIILLFPMGGERHFFANLEDGAKYFRYFLHVFHGQAVKIKVWMHLSG